MNQLPPYRRRRAHISQFSTAQLHLKNPLVVAFFSFSYPGFGHLLLHRYAAALMLISWELFINNLANVNLGVLYSLLGDFDKAKEVLDERWLILYVGIYMFGIWDGYRTAVDLNKQYLLADWEDFPLSPLKLGAWDLNYLDKRKPWVALSWSTLIPGLGHLYLHKVMVGFFIFGYTIAIMYYSHIPIAIQYSLIGEFAKVSEVLDMQWTLYLPSIHLFIIYDAYVSAVEYNKLCEKELSNYLRRTYQNPNFKLPI
ncbi:hypothetical protein [Bacillus taeanensis]|uniref:Uncharacterized protein n=1 Tax=Bacillus taeanensis TaxID=273032 RepID=A0A366XUZ2_9BACI|nr:hypothetical protein [Bacillus taeanensis]RBW67944.1 hypothetical protein DS031_19245 [Bacillus taeanensis]